jgi:hypothetical protein
MNTEYDPGRTGISNAQVQPRKRSLKEKAAEEFKMFWAIAIYLALMFAAFTWYRRFILSDSGISYFHYGSAIVGGLILAKIILIGQALGLGRQFEHLPLIIPVVIKALAYAVFAGLFFMLEHLVEGLVHGESWVQIQHGVIRAGQNEVLAKTIMVIVAFIPFFAFWETERVLGEGRLSFLFFHHRMP